MGTWCPSPGSSSVPVDACRLVSVRLWVWSQEESSLHIVLEMKAIVVALAAFLPQLLGQSVVLMSDNATVVTYLRNQGSIVSCVLCRMAAKVVLWTE